MRKAYKIFAVTLILLVIATPVFAITNGIPDDGEHPYVGLMLYPVEETPEGTLYAICSGTLISPTLFLTAAHCVYDAEVGNIPIFVSFAEQGISIDSIGFGHAHPSYPGILVLPATYDVGVVELIIPVTDLGFGEVAEVGYLEQFKKKVGLSDPYFEPVGYGLQSALPGLGNYQEWDIARYKGEQRLINLQNALVGDYNVQLTNNPGKGNGSGGTCSGDSGGPILYNDTNIITAVNSFGIAPYCVGTDYAYRVDTQLVHDFLATFGY